MKKPRPVRHRLEYALYRAVGGLMQRLPPSAALRAGRALGRVAHRVLSRDRRLARENLRAVLPELDARARRETVARCYLHYGEVLALAFRAAREGAERFRERVPIEGAEHLSAAVESGRGVVLVSGHFGYWELSSLRIGLELGKLTVVYRPLDNPWIDRHVAALRERFGIELVPKSGAATTLLRALKRGEAIGLLPDQRVPARQGLVVPFLGRPALTTTLPAALASRTGCAVLPTFCLPDGAGGAGVRVEPPVQTELSAEDVAAALARRDEALARAGAEAPAPEGDDAERIALTERIMAPLEREIRERPHLWLWPHRRWQLGR